MAKIMKPWWRHSIGDVQLELQNESMKSLADRPWVDWSVPDE
jgi:hypothetical protein